MLEGELSYLKKTYYKNQQVYIDKEILLNKQINKLQVNDPNYFDHNENKKIIKFDRNEFDDFTIIKVNYVQSE